MNFYAYISDKYKEVANTANLDPIIYARSTVHHYEKIITQFDQNTQTTTTNTIIIDQNTYNNIVPSTHTYTLPTGPVTVTTTANAVDVLVYYAESTTRITSVLLNNVS